MHGKLSESKLAALLDYFQRPLPRTQHGLPRELLEVFESWSGSGIIGRRIVEGIIVVPWLIYAVVSFVSLARGRAYAQDVIGTTLGSALGLGLFVLLPLRLFFRSIIARDKSLVDAIKAAPAKWLPVLSSERLTRYPAKGQAFEVWQLTVRLPLLDERSQLVFDIPCGADELIPPARVLVATTQGGDSLVICEAPAYSVLVGDHRRSAPTRIGPN